MRTGSKELLFFLTPKDLTVVIDEFEKAYNVIYNNMDISDEKLLNIKSISKKYLLEQLTIGDWNHSPSYLITDSKVKIIANKTTLRKGGVVFSINQLDNPNSVVFKPSGVFVEGILIAGSLTTISTAPYSLKMFQIFAKIIKKYSVRIGAFYVGVDAKIKLTLGWRLVTSASSPKEYDLVL